MSLMHLLRFFEGNQIAVRLTVYQKKNHLIFRVKRPWLEHTINSMEKMRPKGFVYKYKPMNWWDRFLTRQRKVRLEMK